MSFEPVDIISSNLHQYITVTSLRDFRDLDHIFKVIVLYVEYLLNQWMDFLQTYINISQ